MENEGDGDRRVELARLDPGLEVSDPLLEGEGILVEGGPRGEAAADMVRGHHPIAIAELEDERSVIERPGWVPVDHDHRVTAALVDVVVV